MSKRETRSSPNKRVNIAEQKGNGIRNYLLIATCGVLLVSGFFFAGRQHFSSMDYGMKNSKLRRQVDLLQAEKRRLMLAREVSLTPNEIKKAIQKVGFRSSTPDGENAQLASVSNEKAIADTGAAAKPLVVKTAAVTAAQSTVQTAALKLRKPEIAKRTIAAE
ncbi:MAG: hypothetical protein AB7J13_07390 [Pyrinomonadaceae bacterium]